MLINLVKNGVEAIKKVGTNVDIKAKVSICWQQQGKKLKLSIVDDGTGVSNPDNLFVPFYTTKAKGSGIGLVLCRQIIEAHGGKLSLVNRTEAKGCIAVIELSLLFNRNGFSHFYRKCSCTTMISFYCDVYVGDFSMFLLFGSAIMFE